RRRVFHGRRPSLISCSELPADQRLTAHPNHITVPTRGRRVAVPRDSLGHIYRLSTLRQAVHAATGLTDGKRHGSSHLGFDKAWCDGVDGDAVLQMAGHGFDIANHAAFSTGI